MNEMKLRRLAICYQLAREYDYCPHPEEFDEDDFRSIVKLPPWFSRDDLCDCAGLRPDEIAREFVGEILR